MTHNWDLFSCKTHYFGADGYRALPELLESVADWLRETGNAVDSLNISSFWSDEGEEEVWTATLVHSSTVADGYPCKACGR